MPRTKSAPPIELIPPAPPGTGSVLLSPEQRGQDDTHRQPPRLLNLAEVAELLAVSVPTLRRLIARRKLATVRIGRAVRVAETDIRAFVAARRRPAR